MHDVLSFLDSHSGSITAIATILLAIITGIYVVLTRLLLKETQAARRISLIEKQLRDFYTPLRLLVTKAKHWDNTILREQEFERVKEYFYLCQNKKIREALTLIIYSSIDDSKKKELLDSIREEVENEFENLKKKL